jgi:filamentous hemagglutinin family protein
MTTSWKNWNWFLVLGSLLAIGGGISASFNNCALAQPIADDTLGAESSAVTPNVLIRGLPSARIDGGAIRGANLLHSFQEFNIDQGRGAYFTNPAGIENILTRVTGGNASEILGRLGVLGNANLFMINPNGIIFGPNARLDIRGSFVATTANAIRLSNGDIFSVNSVESLPTGLLNVNPNAFLFNQIAEQAKAIINRSTAEGKGLQVPQGRSLLLVGGDVRLEGGRLFAEGGRVELGGVASTGSVGLSIDGDNVRLSFPNDVARASVSLTDKSEVNVAAGGGGSIALNARNVDILGGSSLRAGIKPLSGFLGAQAGDITLNATGAVKINNGFIYNAVFGDGNGGNVSIDTGQLIVKDGLVATATVSRGLAGNLTVNASDSVDLTSTLAGGTVALDIPVDFSFLGFFNFSTKVPIKVPIGLLAVSVDITTLIDPNANAIRELAFLLPQPGGNVGNLTINTRQLFVQGGATVVASTVSNEQGGNLIVNARELIKLSGTSTSGDPTVSLTIDNVIPSGFRNEALGSGSNGDLIINTGQLIVQDGAFVTAGTAGGKRGGNLTVNAKDFVELIGISSVNGIPSVLATGTRRDGDSINLTINTGRLTIRDGAVVSAGTSSVGQGGNLTVNAKDSVELIDTAAVPASQSAYNALLGDSGVSVFGIVAGRPFPSGLITGTAGAGSAGNLTINTGRLVVRDGAQASVSTLGSGNGGNLIVDASSVELSGSSQQSSNPNDIVGRSLLTTAVGQNSTGNGGDIRVQANLLKITDGATVTASTQGRGNAGNIVVQADTVQATTGGQFRTSTASGNNAGNITFEVGDRLTITGEDSGLFANTELGSVGNSGSIFIEPTQKLTIQDGARIAVDSQGSGEGGNIQIQAGTVNLDNRSLISAQTASNQGGNVTLQLQDLLLLRRNSQISTTAGTAGAGGNGGSITIKTPFIVASENSDITANAFNGTGGKVEIDATAIFGMVVRSREDLVKLLGTPPLDPIRLPTNDITAISQENPSLSGQVIVNTPNVDPVRGLVNLPTAPVDTEVAQGCYTGGTQAQSKFIITGRGGLPPNPKDVLTPDTAQIDWVSVKPSNNNRSLLPVTSKPTTSTPKRIVEATGATLNAKGQIVLSANSSTVSTHSSIQNPVQCHGS